MSEAVVEKALIGGGCFWCTEAIFTGLRGVKSAQPGYAGGRRENPSYEQVCSGATGHAEVVEVVFDPQEISYGDILRVFYTTHDPTQLNRQGNDIVALSKGNFMAKQGHRGTHSSTNK